MMIDDFKNMQIELKRGILRNNFENYGSLVARYLEKANEAAQNGKYTKVDRWTKKALKCAKARDKLVNKIEKLSV